MAWVIRKQVSRNDALLDGIIRERVEAVPQDGAWEGLVCVYLV